MKMYYNRCDMTNTFVIHLMNLVVDYLEKGFPRRKIDIFGKDSLIRTCIPYYLLAALSFSGLVLPTPDPFIYLVIVYTAIPLLDEIFSFDCRNPSQKERKQLEENDGYFRYALYAAVIFDWGNFFKTLIIFSNLQISASSLPQLIASIFIMSNLCAAQFAVAHEIMHKPGKFYKFIATIHMSKLYYMHFTYHHLFNHHAKVATSEDPSSADIGESFYTFFWNCVKKSWIGVYNDEKKIAKPFYFNYAILSIFATLSFITILLFAVGLQATIIHTLIAMGAIVYLEAINYLEHYGLRRKKLSNGEYQKVTILHSWNAPQRFSNYLLFKLQRHSDHHENSLKPYQTLVSLEQSPFLPHGYTLMVLMALIPKVFFKVMDPLVKQYSNINQNSTQGSKSISPQKSAISPEVYEKSMKETRKFLIGLGGFMLTIMIVSKIALV